MRATIMWTLTLRRGYTEIMSRAFVDEDAGGQDATRYTLPDRTDPGYDLAAARALLRQLDRFTRAQKPLVYRHLGQHAFELGDVRRGVVYYLKMTRYDPLLSLAIGIAKVARLCGLERFIGPLRKASSES